MSPKKFIIASLFQFSVLGVLTYALISGIGDSEFILGALTGVMVGVGVDSIREFPDKKDDAKG